MSSKKKKEARKTLVPRLDISDTQRKALEQMDRAMDTLEFGNIYDALPLLHAAWGVVVELFGIK